MKTSESIKTIIPALLRAQKRIEGAEKNAQNPYFKSKYADLPAVIEACKSALNENDIVALQPIQGGCVETILIHSSGEWLSSETNIVCKAQNDPQAYGSAITYARRYGLQSFVLMPAEDDDSELAMNRVHVKTKLTEDEQLELKAGLTLDKPLSTTATDLVLELATKMSKTDDSMNLKAWASTISLTYFKVDNSAAIKKLETEKLKEGIERITAKLEGMK